MLTFHKIIAGCETGDANAWRAFLADYTPIILQLTRIYLPDLSTPEEQWPEEQWKDTLRALSDDNFRALRGFGHQSEREFLIDLRAFYLERASSAPKGFGSADDLPAPATASMIALLKGAPLVHQEVIFLKLAGYSDSMLEKMLRITPAVAQSSLAHLKERGSKSSGALPKEGLRPAAWLKMLRELWAAKTEACPPLRLLIRIQDGQIGWQEKEPAEKHITDCLRCLERWTALKEFAYWRRVTEPCPAAQVEELLSVIPVHETASKQKSFFSRMLKKRGSMSF